MGRTRTHGTRKAGWGNSRSTQISLCSEKSNLTTTWAGPSRKLKGTDMALIILTKPEGRPPGPKRSTQLKAVRKNPQQNRTMAASTPIGAKSEDP